MAIAVTCASCRATFNVDDKYAGRKGPCPKCKATIEIPKVEKVVIHEDEMTSVAAGSAAAAGPVSGKKINPKASLRPIARSETEFRAAPAIAIVAAILLLFAATYVLRGMIVKMPSLRVLGLFLVSLPASIGAYTILRNDELEPYRGGALWWRTAVCGLIYTAFWIGFAFIPPDLVKAAYTWALIVPVPVVICGSLAMIFYDLDFSGGVFHYMWYLALTLALGYVAGLPWPWAGVTL